jgi:hypothetical protein
VRKRTALVAVGDRTHGRRIDGAAAVYDTTRSRAQRGPCTHTLASRDYNRASEPQPPAVSRLPSVTSGTPKEFPCCVALLRCRS